MSDLMNGLLKITEVIKKTVEAADNVIKSSLSGGCVQRSSESDEAYKARLQFLKERKVRLQEARKERQESKAERQEAKHRRWLERAEIKASRKQ